MRRYNNLAITQIIVLLAVADRLVSGNAPLKRVSGTVRAGLIAKSGKCSFQCLCLLVIFAKRQFSTFAHLVAFCNPTKTLLKYLHAVIFYNLRPSFSDVCARQDDHHITLKSSLYFL